MPVSEGEDSEHMWTLSQCLSQCIHDVKCHQVSSECSREGSSSKFTHLGLNRLGSLRTVGLKCLCSSLAVILRPPSDSCHTVLLSVVAWFLKNASKRELARGQEQMSKTFLTQLWKQFSYTLFKQNKSLVPDHTSKFQMLYQSNSDNICNMQPQYLPLW